MRREALARCGGRCEACRAVLVKGGYQYDHDLPDAFGGPPTLANCRVLCTACHQAKRDWTAISKSNRIRKKHATPTEPRKPPAERVKFRGRSGFEQRKGNWKWPSKKFETRRP